VININNKSGKRGYDNQTAMQREQHAGAVEKERRYCRKYLLINLNLNEEWHSGRKNYYA
jgi:hypothetical protein